MHHVSFMTYSASTTLTCARLALVTHAPTPGTCLQPKGMFVVHVHSHHHPVWFATRVRGVDAWVTGANGAQVCLLIKKYDA